MRFMMLVKANKDSEAGVLPSEQVLAEMGTFNEEMVKAGVMRSADGLQPTSKGTRVGLSGGTFTLTDGPFTESKELIAGFWIIEVKSRDEAIAWARRAPGVAGEIELREMFGGSEPIRFAARDETKRRYMSMYTPADTSGRLPTEDEMARMGKFIEEGIKAGALLETGGLTPGVRGIRVAFSGKGRTVTDGPFTEAKELVGGYAILQARSKDEVVDMTKRFLEVAGDGETEIRPVYELSDFPAGDAIDHHARLRDTLTRR